jgi:pimeloyl-ACP methyl ester carboxylesterase
MDDPCNLSREQQMTFVPSLIAAPCAPSYTGDVTTIGSDWDDIDAVVDHLRALRHVERVSLVAWSLGAPRAGGYANKHAEKVDRLVLLAPAPPGTPNPAANAAPFGTQSRSEFVANWDRQVGCPVQYDQAVGDSVWSEMQASDSVGATWGSGVRRASNARRVAGWDPSSIGNLKIPTLLVAGVHDKQVDPASVRQLHTVIGATDKVFIDLGCSSHNAMWEKNHRVLFEASRLLLTIGAVNGAKTGSLLLGYGAADNKTN